MTPELILAKRTPPTPTDRPVEPGSHAQGRPRAIPSAELLLGAASVTIDHDGTHYVLRATRAGKLILTK